MTTYKISARKQTAQWTEYKGNTVKQRWSNHREHYTAVATVHLMRDAGKPVRQNNQLCTRYFFLFTTTVDEVHLGIVVRLFGQLVNFHSASAFYSHILTAALSLNKQHTK